MSYLCWTNFGSLTSALQTCEWHDMVGPMSTSLQQQQDGGPTLALQRLDRRAMVNLWGRGIAFFSIESITNINAHIYQCSGMVWYFFSKKKCSSCSLISFLLMHLSISWWKSAIGPLFTLLKDGWCNLHKHDVGLTKIYYMGELSCCYGLNYFVEPLSFIHVPIWLVISRPYRLHSHVE